MKRSTPLRRRVRIGQAARRRVKAGGKLAVGRQSADLGSWREIIRQVRGRSGGRCEVVVWELRDSENAYWRCVRRAVDPHHVIPRSKGGADDPWNLMAVCRVCHNWFDLPYEKGRLVAEWVSPQLYPETPSGYLCRVVRARDKFEARLLASLNP